MSSRITVDESFIQISITNRRRISTRIMQVGILQQIVKLMLSKYFQFKKKCNAEVGELQARNFGFVGIKSIFEYLQGKGTKQTLADISLRVRAAVHKGLSSDPPPTKPHKKFEGYSQCPSNEKCKFPASRLNFRNFSSPSILITCSVSRGVPAVVFKGPSTVCRKFLQSISGVSAACFWDSATNFRNRSPKRHKLDFKRVCD